MDRNRALSLSLGLATILVMVIVGYAMTRTPPWLSPALGLSALGALATWLMVLRSPQEIPYPRPAPSDKPAAPPKDPPNVAGIVLAIAVGSVIASTPYALCSCASEKPIVKANPAAADCIANKGIRERECLINERTEADVDACLANVRAHTECTDGGK